MKRVDRGVAVFLLVLGLVAAFESLRLGLERSGLPGPGLFPLLASSGIVLLAAVRIFESRRLSDEQPPSWPSPEGLKKTLTFAASLLVYVALSPQIGFLLATFLFLTLMIRFPGGYAWRNSLTVSLTLSLALYLGLGRLLGVSLPHGFMGMLGI